MKSPNNMLHITIQSIKISRNIAIYFGLIRVYSFSGYSMLHTHNLIR